MRVTGRASYPRHPLGRGEVGTGQTDIALCGAVQVSNRIDLGDENGNAKHRSKLGAKRYLNRRPLKSGGLERLRISLYGVGRGVNSNLI
jgi:hypothetical protein